MTIEFLSPVNCINELEMEECNSIEIVELTCLEDLTIKKKVNETEEFFILYLN
jgi:hypothetical protein